MYDVTKRATFDNIVHWIKELKASAEPNIIVMLVGNKIDLCAEDTTLRQVTKEEGEKLAKQYNMLFEETSATEDTNVKSAFENLLLSIRSANIV